MCLLVFILFFSKNVSKYIYILVYIYITTYIWIYPCYNQTYKLKSYISSLYIKITNSLSHKLSINNTIEY